MKFLIIIVIPIVDFASLFYLTWNIIGDHFKDHSNENFMILRFVFSIASGAIFLLLIYYCWFVCGLWENFFVILYFLPFLIVSGSFISKWWNS